MLRPSSSMRSATSCFTPASTASGFDLATALGREARDFDPDARLFDAILTDPVLSGRVMIAEPWDIGPNGYQLGNFPPPFLEWNDRFRDDIRTVLARRRRHHRCLATRLAGLSDISGKVGQPETRSVDFSRCP